MRACVWRPMALGPAGACAHDAQCRHWANARAPRTCARVYAVQRVSPGAASCSALVLPLALGASKPCAPRGFRAVRAPDLVPGARSSPRLKSGPPRWVASGCQTSCPTCNSQVGFVSPCVAMLVWGTAPARQHISILGAGMHASSMPCKSTRACSSLTACVGTACVQAEKELCKWTAWRGG